MPRKSRLKKGIVYLVGAGPGDPGLLTVKAQRLLHSADCVIYDHLVSPEILQESSPKAALIDVGKEPGKRGITQSMINARLIRSARSGKRVVRLKGGDPMLFGRGAEEALALHRAHVSFEIVPGITSALAVPTYAGIPVTHRELSSSVAILTGHLARPQVPGEEDGEGSKRTICWDALARSCDTLIFLMGMSTLPEIITRLIESGKRDKTPCAVIAEGTRPSQRVVTGSLKTIIERVREGALQPPAILIVGEGVPWRRYLKWFEKRSLLGWRILITRAADRAESLAQQLSERGAEIVRLPAIELVGMSANGVFRKAIKELPMTDWVFFTSPEGILWFRELLRSLRKDVRVLAGCHIGAIGAKTASAIEASGLHVDFIPKAFRQERMLEEFPRTLSRGKRALIFSAVGSRDVLMNGLRERGMRIRRVPIYRTVVPRILTAKLSLLEKQPFDFVTVTSTSCVTHLWQALEAEGKSLIFSRLRFASIGPVTSQAVRSHGGKILVEAKVSTVEGLIEAMGRFAKAHPMATSPS